MIEPRILALGNELRDSTASMLAGLFVLLGNNYAQSAAMLRRAAEVEGEDVPAIEMAARAIEEQTGKLQTPLGMILQKALEVTARR